MKKLLLIIFLLASCSLFGQSNEPYEGGLMELYKTMAKNMRYPANDRSNGTQGLVLLSFKVNDKQSPDSIVVVNSVSSTMDQEAIRVFKMTEGKWKVSPGPRYLIPIKFRLDYPKMTEIKILKEDIDRYLKNANHEKAIKTMLEIVRREPLDMENLDKLIAAYQFMGYASQEAKMTELKKLLVNFQNDDRIIGRFIK